MQVLQQSDSTTNQPNAKKYPLATFGEENQVASSPNFPQLEAETLAFWKKQEVFERSVENRPSGEDSSNEFVFFDGPPFANGLPHYGHLLTGYAKDVIPRYQTMKGRRVNRVFGWDTHGLPAELEAQKELGIESVDQIQHLGIEAFNQACRTSVLKYSNEWKAYVERQGRWVDFEHGYKTMDVNYMESVIWAFKQLYDKGLAYQGFRVLPYCPKDQTPLSAHELRMDADVYQDRQDITVSVAVKLEDQEDAYAVFWTTTPWTVPTNFAIVVGADITYVQVRPTQGAFAGKSFYIAQALLGMYAKELGEDYEIVRTLPGSAMDGWKYYPVFPYFASEEARSEQGTPDLAAFTITTADYVDVSEGTGLVHQAPYGEDDMNTLNAMGIRAVDVLDNACRFTAVCPEYEGMSAFDANMPIIRNLRAGDGPLASVDPSKRAILFQEKSYVHSYPHCWRCSTPLIYKPVSSWFVAVTSIKERLLELNQDIHWIPSNVQDGQFGKWLQNSRDWSISRNRFWGSPIPVWVSDNPEYPRIDVYGSLEELKRDFGDYPRDEQGKINMHRPYIDRLTRPNPDDPTGQSHMHRISDVLDCWFESGSMPFAQFHYPFENKEFFEKHFPCDYIVEYIGQTRGWFYTLHIMATALFDRAAFRNVICHGIVLGSDGQKMSKRLRNYPDVNGVFNEYGSDAMRWFLMSSPILRGGNLIVTSQAIRDTVRQTMLPLWSSYYFFTLYANAAAQGQGVVVKSLQPDDYAKLEPMDRYLLARTRQLIERTTSALDDFLISDACESINDFLDMLTNWYIRNSRDRFWNEDAYAMRTLYTVLETLTRLAAPLLPMESEVIWRGLTGGESVHLATWPFVADPETKDSTALGRVLLEDEDLVAAMEEVRAIVSGVLSLRKATNLRVRQPLSSLTIVTQLPARIAPYEALIAREVNVKSMCMFTLAQAVEQGFAILETLTVKARVAGPRLGKAVQAVIQASKQGKWRHEDGKILVETPQGEIALLEEEYELSRRVEHNTGERTAHDENAESSIHESPMVSAVLADGSFIVLDTTLTEELQAEGYARDLIRTIQDARKNKGFEVSDRIVLTLGVPQDNLAWLESMKELVAQETLATSLKVQASSSQELEIDIQAA